MPFRPRRVRGIVAQMKAETANFLRDLNWHFYSQFAGAFASTRRRLQPGVERLLAELPDRGDWLDIGCGSGWLAVEWLRRGRRSAYLGVDFSPGLLDEARQQVEAAGGGGRTVDFKQVDLTQPDWAFPLAGGGFVGGLCFAVLHHIPGHTQRQVFLRGAAGLIPPGGLLALSVWQFQNSPKLAGRVLPWEQVGLAHADVEEGDTLLDWRHALPGQTEQVGCRYVHQFSAPELAGLAETCGFAVEQSFESDGEGGRLGLYQVWRRL